jgi:hypothetical protein
MHWLQRCMGFNGAKRLLDSTQINLLETTRHRALLGFTV